MLARLRRGPLVAAALLALLATVVVIAIVATGVLHDDRARTAERLTARCAPVAAVMTYRTPEAVTTRQLLRLKQEAARAAEDLGELVKDASSDLRGPLREIRVAFEVASDRDGAIPNRQRGEVLARAATVARSFGARCPAPFTEAQGAAIDRRLSRDRRP